MIRYTFDTVTHPVTEYVETDARCRAVINFFAYSLNTYQMTEATTKIVNKTVVVTGGSRGIGLEFVKELLQQGNTVVATARDPSKSPGLQDLAKQYGDKLIPLELEVSSPESIAAWATQLAGRLSHIDVFISNAGVSYEELPWDMTVVTPKILIDTYTTNTMGPFLATQELLKHGLLGGGTPSLCVYITSLGGSIGDTSLKQVRVYAYRASKAALNMLVHTLAEELAPKNITSVLLHPGFVATDMTANIPGGISTTESVAAMLKVLEDGRPLNGKFYSYTGEELPW